uniref:RRM domain-containing protein n=1 Tax=Araucaria cunninghamii TaxID=56994 RepID=A0A0D6R1Y2_ARACU
MRRHSPSFSPPRRGYGGRPRSPPRGRYGGYGGRREPNTSLLVRNIPRDCRPDELRIPFERFGPLKDVYLPKDYYTGEPRGFGFVQFMDPLDAAEAQYHMDGQYIGGREITVVLAEENRKKPDEMRVRSRPRAPRGYGRHRSPYYARSRSRSRSRSPGYRSTSFRGHHSRSYSPGPRRGHDRSISPRERHHRSRSISHDRDEGRSPVRRSYSSQRSRDGKRGSAGNGHRDSVSRSRSPDRDSQSPVAPRRRRHSNSPRSRSRSLSGSRSRSADLSARD